MSYNYIHITIYCIKIRYKFILNLKYVRQKKIKPSKNVFNFSTNNMHVGANR